MQAISMYMYMLYAVLPILCDETLTIETRVYTTRVSKVLYMRPITYGITHEDMHTASQETDRA